MADPEKVAAGLLAAAERIPREVDKVLKKGALEIKRDAISGISDHRSWSWLKGELTFDPVPDGYEVGFLDPGADELALVHEHGTARHAARPFLGPAVDAEAPKIAEHILKAVNREVKRAAR